jgi:hypothetical protein
MPDRVHGNTKKAADMALAKKAISPDSHRAIHEGRIDLEEARSLGREGSPFGPAPKAVDKNDRSRRCIACGGNTKGGRFHPGCDAKMHRLAREYVRGERELTPEQMEYVEQSGKLERAKARIADEDRKKAAKEQGETSMKRDG